MSPPSFNPSSIATTGDITLVLGRRTSGIKGHRVKMHNDVVTVLRGMCDETIAHLGDRKPIAYADDLSFDSDSQYMVAETATTLVAHVPEIRRGRRSDNEPPERPLVEVDAAARRVLADASSQSLIDSAEIERRRSFLFSAAVVGDDPQSRTAFVSAYNPYRAAERGRLVTSFGDSLRRVTGPLLAFQPVFDMVVTDTQVAILRGDAFEKVFRDIDSMRERIPTWAKAVTDALPLDAASADRVRQLTESRPLVARHVRSMYERGVLAKKFKLPALRQQLQQEGFDLERVIQNGKLVLEDEELPDFLKLLDERLVTGWHSGTHWDVGTRSPRSR